MFDPIIAFLLKVFIAVMEFLREYGTVVGHGLTWILCTFVIPVLPYLPGGTVLLDFLLGLLYWDTPQRVLVISCLWLATWRFVRQKPFFYLDLGYRWYHLKRRFRRLIDGLFNGGPPPGAKN